MKEQAIKSLPARGVSRQKQGWLQALKALFFKDRRIDARRGPSVARHFRPIHNFTRARMSRVQRDKDIEYWERSANFWADKSYGVGLHPDTRAVYDSRAAGCREKAEALA